MVSKATAHTGASYCFAELTKFRVEVTDRVAIMGAGMRRMAAARMCAVGVGCLTLAGLVACGSVGDPPSFGDGDGDADGDAGANELLDFVPSNIPADALLIGTANVTIDSDVVINSVDGTIIDGGGADIVPPDSIFVVVAQGPGEPSLGVYSWANLTVAPGVTIRVEGANGLVFALSENAIVSGVIDASGGSIAGLETAGAGGFAGGDALTLDGAGIGGGKFESDYDAGGGGGAHAAPGGAGGEQEGRPGGIAGNPYGILTNTPLVGGSGGGRGGNGSGLPGVGGGGGGAVQISARGEIRFDAQSGINVGGAGGQGGDNDDAGGGGGAGGAILLEARTLVVEGILAANGGGGGAGANQGNKGSDGANAGLDALIAAGGNGAGEGSSGGAGAAADIMMGAPGLPTIANSGGGGGSGGRIYLRSRVEASMTGQVSPSGAIGTGVL